MTTSSQLDMLILVSWILLIPVGILLAVVLFQLACLLRGLSEFLTLSRYDAYQILKDLRRLTGHIDQLSEKVVETLENAEREVHAASTGVKKLKHYSRELLGSIGGIPGTLVRVLWDVGWAIKGSKKRKAL